MFDECRHCGKHVSHDRRGLCNTCYRTSAIRIKYPPDPQDDQQFEPPAPNKPASAPTAHPPGSREKIAVMRARYANREHIHHPDDAKIGDDVVIPRRSRLFKIDGQSDRPSRAKHAE